MKYLILKPAMIVAVLLSFIPSFAYDFEVDGIYYNVLSLPDLTCEVTYGDTRYTDDVIIPANVGYRDKTLSVVRIGCSAFSSCSNLSSVIIGENVVSIEIYAFKGCKCNSIFIPASVKYFDIDAFYASNIEEVHISDLEAWCNIYRYSQDVSVGNSLFIDGVAANDIVIPKTVTTLEGTFNGFKNINSVVIPNGVTTIGEYTFYRCSGLNSVNIPNTVTEICDRAFQYCSGLESIAIPESVTKIGKYAFFHAGVVSMKIPDSVTEIGECAIISPSTKEIYVGTGLNSLITDHYKDNQWQKYISATLFNLYYDFKLSETCSSLETIVIEDAETPIECSRETHLGWIFPFVDIPSLQGLYIGRNIPDAYGIANLIRNSNLKELEIGDLCTEIPRIECYSLKKLTIGNRIVEINPQKISQENLQEIYLRCTTPPSMYYNYDFKHETYLNTNVYVPKGTLGAYQQAEGWKNFWNLQEYDLVSGIVGIAKDNLGISINGLTIFNMNGATISVHDMTGKVVYNGSSKEIRLPTPGLYMITHDSGSVKILAK